ncbi:MAG: MFS transporter [Muribaculaceae bacterium]|nr:MFS transporter [Muribaculaceae bacterium]
MTEVIKKALNDKAWARWTALILIALAMFFAYMFVDVMSPLQSLVEKSRGWTSETFGVYAASEYALNVCGFLILAGIILDKMGVRFTGILSTSLMVIGASIKFLAISDWFQATSFCAWLDSWWVSLPGTAKMASLGFMIFGCGCEMAGITVSKAIARWFEGKEMALAMGLEMAIARLGVFAVLSIAPRISKAFVDTAGNESVVAPIAFCTALLLIGLINFCVFSVMDKRLDRDLGVDKSASDEEFKASDIKIIFRTKMFWIVALLCVLYYSAIFPFQRYATNFFEETLHIPNGEAADILRWFPILAMALTPFLGYFLDKIGKGASMLLLGAVIMIVCHLSFAFILPMFPSKLLAFIITIVLGVSFSLVPAALWPSVPKIIDSKILGSAYSLIFWIQNIGLCLVPYMIGAVRESTGSYFVPMLIFSSFGFLAVIFSIMLKIEDNRKNYHLERPNMESKKKA